MASGRFEPTRPVWEAIRQWRPLMEKPDVSGTCEWLQVLLELTRAQEAVTSFAVKRRSGNLIARPGAPSSFLFLVRMLRS